MHITKDAKVITLSLSGRYEKFEIKLHMPDFNILGIYKQTYPDYWVASSIDSLDYEAQDKLFSLIRKLKKEYESKP